MVNSHAREIKDGVAARLAPLTGVAIGSGHEAAVAVVELMQRTFTGLAPDDLIRVYVEGKGVDADGVFDTTKGLGKGAKALWETFDDATIDRFTDGCRCLALLWDSAWNQGHALREAEGKGKITDLGEVDRDRLTQLYESREFLPSLFLDEIDSILRK
jgi:hypothetical protein